MSINIFLSLHQYTPLPLWISVLLCQCILYPFMSILFYPPSIRVHLLLSLHQSAINSISFNHILYIIFYLLINPKSHIFFKILVFLSKSISPLIRVNYFISFWQIKILLISFLNPSFSSKSIPRPSTSIHFYLFAVPLFFCISVFFPSLSKKLYT